MPKSFDIAVVGATGLVGESMLEILAERKFPVGKVHALASERSVGENLQHALTDQAGRDGRQKGRDY